MVQEIEELRPELKFFGFRYLDVLEGREIPIHIPRPCDHVATFVSKYLEPPKRIGSELLKSALQGVIRRIKYGEGASANASFLKPFMRLPCVLPNRY